VTAPSIIYCTHSARKHQHWCNRN